MTTYSDISYATTSYSATTKGRGIYCDNTEIYCDSEDYYCDGSQVMHDISHSTTTYYDVEHS